MQANEDKLIARLFKDTLIIILLSLFVSRVGNVIDGIITGKFPRHEGTDGFRADDFLDGRDVYVHGTTCKPARRGRKISTAFDYVNVLKLNNLVIKF